MWLTERTILELAYRHQDDMERAQAMAAPKHLHGPVAVLPRPCCRYLARVGHRMAVVGMRMETRYSHALTTT